MDHNAWDERYRSTPTLWGQEPNQYVAQAFGDRKPGRVLDLACGNGRNSLWLASRGWQVTAVDFSAVAIDEGRSRGEAAKLNETITWIRSDLTDPADHEPEARSFDAVIIAYLHLPAEDFRGVLSRAAGALAPGGRLLVIGHDKTNIAQGVGGPQDIEILHTHEAVTAELTGLRVLRAERAERVVQGADRPALDTLVLAERPSEQPSARGSEHLSDE